MGNVPSTHIFMENLCRAGYEIGFPEDADTIGFKGSLISLWGLSYLPSSSALSLDINQNSNQKGGNDHGDD